MEEWRDIPGLEGYKASNLGRIRGTRFDKPLSLSINSCGYLTFSAGQFRTYLVSRAVAQAFIPNPENKYSVDHINRIKTDNRIENLRWATHQEQMLNRNIFKYSKTNTGEKHICLSKTNNLYLCNIRRQNLKKSGWFKTLEEAIAFRDRVLSQNKENESSDTDNNIDTR